MHIQKKIWTFITSAFAFVTAVAIVLFGILNIATVPSTVAQLPQLARAIMGLPTWFSLGLAPFLSVAWLTWVLLQERRWGKRVAKLDSEIRSLRSEWGALNQRASTEVTNAIDNYFNLYTQGHLSRLEESITRKVIERQKIEETSITLDISKSTKQLINWNIEIDQKIASIEQRLSDRS